MSDTPAPSPDVNEAMQAQISQLQQQLKLSELRSHAKAAGIVDMDGLKLADMSTLTFDSNGALEGAATLVDQLKRDKPWLFSKSTTEQTPSPAARHSSHPAPAPQAEEPKPRDAKTMSYAEWRQARERLLRRK